MSPATDPSEVQHQVGQWAARELGEWADSVFIYGSVAAGTATPASDIDCVILTTDEVSHDLQMQISAGFIGLQQRLGYTPDLLFPIELFTVEQCRETLGSRETRLRVLSLSSTASETNFLISDGAEILRALLSRRVTVWPSPNLDELTLRADSFAATIGDQTAWLDRLGVKHQRPHSSTGIEAL